MKKLSQLVGLAGILVIMLAVFGRFHGPSTMTIYGHQFAAASVLIMGNSLLLIGIFMALMTPPGKQPDA